MENQNIKEKAKLVKESESKSITRSLIYIDCKEAWHRATINEALKESNISALEVLQDFAENYKKSPAYIAKCRAMVEELKKMGINI